MASIHLDPDSPFYRIRFRHDGRNINRSLKTKDKRRAQALCLQVEETIELVSRGRIEIPADSDPVRYILADGRPGGSNKKTPQPKAIGLSSLFATYEDSLPVGRKEESTLISERIHIKQTEKTWR